MAVELYATVASLCCHTWWSYCT